MPSKKRQIRYHHTGDKVLSSQTDYYKSAALFLAGVVVSGGLSWFLGPKNVVTQEELRIQMPALMSQFNPYMQDQTLLKEQLTNVRTDQAKQGLVLERTSSAVEQLEMDVARISDKVGVPAHPTSKIEQ